MIDTIPHNFNLKNEFETDAFNTNIIMNFSKILDLVNVCCRFDEKIRRFKLIHG
jgi:hypothetical protein